MMLEDILKYELTKNLLRYAISLKMSCSTCDRILDAPTTILLKNPTGLVCVGCFEHWFENVKRKYKDRFDPDPYQKHGLTVEHRNAVIVTQHDQLYNYHVEIDGRNYDWDEK